MPSSNVLQESSGVVPPIGIDLSGTIDEAPIFFQFFTRTYPGKIYVITFGHDLVNARKDVERLNVRYDEVVLVSGFAQKAMEIKRLGIQVYFDDTDEILLHVPVGVTVLKIRNGGNYDYKLRKWLYCHKTGCLI